jgi:hypothetical protein
MGCLAEKSNFSLQFVPFCLPFFIVTLHVWFLVRSGAFICIEGAISNVNSAIPVVRQRQTIRI